VLATVCGGRITHRAPGLEVAGDIAAAGTLSVPGAAAPLGSAESHLEAMR